MNNKSTLLPNSLYQDCIHHYSEIQGTDFVVRNAVPIPYFGDCAQYFQSDLKVVTAALNPSDVEFPKDTESEPRFDLERGLGSPAALEETLSEYFQRNPYTRWFRSFEPVLNGLGASYGGVMSRGEYSNTALHLDMCSPIATSPTWSRLGEDSRNLLTGTGRKIFENLIEALQPQIVVASISWWHIQAWNTEFLNGRSWPVLKSYSDTKTGRPLRSPLTVFGKSISLSGGHQFLFVNGTAANIPFGRFSTERKLEVGKIIASEI